MFAKITEAIQRNYERSWYSCENGTPELCGVYGRACRVMREPYGDGLADRALCDGCALALYASATAAKD